MVYLFESGLPENKPLFFGLTHIYGIGINRSVLVCKKLGFSKNFKVRDLSISQINRVRNFLESLNLIIANDLKIFNSLNKQRLIHIKSYKGLRRNKGFPVRGQRTHTNARTAKKIR